MIAREYWRLALIPDSPEREIITKLGDAIDTVGEEDDLEVTHRGAELRVSIDHAHHTIDVSTDGKCLAATGRHFEEDRTRKEPISAQLGWLLWSYQSRLVWLLSGRGEERV